MPLPDPNQEPTVAQFSGPQPGQKPRMNASTFEKLANAAPDVIGVVKQATSGKVPDPAMAGRVLRAMGGKDAELVADDEEEEDEDPRPRRAPLRRQEAPQGRGAVQGRPKVRNVEDEARKQRHAALRAINELGLILAKVASKYLPGAQVGITFNPDGEGGPEYRVAPFVANDEGQVQQLAHMSADVDSLGQAVFESIQRAQEALDDDDDGEVDGDYDYDEEE